MLGYTLRYLILKTTVIFTVFSLVAGQDICGRYMHVDKESNRYFRSFKHLYNFGLLQCIKLCKHYKLCEKIHHNREELTCDLMMAYADKGDMTSLLDVKSLQIDIKGCSHANCLENEVCVNRANGGHICRVQDVCPTADWVPFNHKCYLFGNGKMTANANVQLCQTMAAEMVRYEEDEVFDFLRLQMNNRGITALFIAANERAVRNVWVWGPGDMVMNTRWVPGEPDNGYENCVIMVTSGWGDIRCETHPAYPVCEIPFTS